MHSRYSDFVILRRESEGQSIGASQVLAGGWESQVLSGGRESQVLAGAGGGRGDGSRAAQRPWRLGANPRAAVDSCSRLRLTL